MDSIIALSFLNKEIEPHLNNNEFIKVFEKSYLFIRPKKFQELQKLVETTFKPENKEIQKLYLTYYGIGPTGESFEIIDDSTFRDDNSIIFICYIKKIEPMFDDIKTNEYFKIGDEKLELEIQKMENIKIDKIIQPNLIRHKSEEIKESQKNLIKDIRKRLIDNLKESMNDLILSSTKEKINKNIGGFRKKFENIINSLFKKKKIV